jgi:hypothetical protein
VLYVVDDALSSAANERAILKSSEQVDKNFEAAIKALDGYHVKYHPERSPSNLCDRMAEARENDQSSSATLNRLKETFCVREKFPPSIRRYPDTTDSQPIEPQPTRIVEFLIHKSLPDRHPTSVKRMCRLVKSAHGI